MNLNELRDEAYSVAKTNGWHEEEHSDKHYLMLIIAEIAEAVQADRNGISPDIDGYKAFIEAHDETCVAYAYNHFIKGCLEEELADVVIRCLDLCGVKGLNAYTVNIEFPTGMDGFTERMFFVCQLLTDRILTNDSTTLKFVLSQAMSYIAKHCRRKGIDLGFFIRAKMRYNRLRGYHHGAKKY